MSEEAFITEARAHLRANLAGAIAFDGEVVPIKVVIAPDGALVAPVMVAMLRAFDVVLFLPEESDEAMQLQVTLEEIQDAGEHAALCDRWRIYHGEPEDVRWARMSIDAAKFDGCMIDGLALMQPNALAACEARVCRKVNAEMRTQLKAACLHAARVDVEDPRLVGVDSIGFDVRGRFEIIRLDADPAIVDEADALEAIGDLADGDESSAADA